MPVIYLLWSLKYGQRAGDNPWRATGLEWQTSSPPIEHNFPQTPVVTTAPYAYKLEGTVNPEPAERELEHA